jgi:hypothetical protein
LRTAPLQDLQCLCGVTGLGRKSCGVIVPPIDLKVDSVRALDHRTDRRLYDLTDRQPNHYAVTALELPFALGLLCHDALFLKAFGPDNLPMISGHQAHSFALNLFPLTQSSISAKKL